jgi:CHAT domain-containing protein
VGALLLLLSATLPLAWFSPLPFLESVAVAQVSNEGEAEQNDDEVLLQIDGVLTENDPKLDDGSLYDEHFFQGQAGQIIKITLESDAFDTYLLLSNSLGEQIAENDDSRIGTNAQIVIQLPMDGQYQIFANAYDATGRGAYRLTIVRSNVEELRQTQALHDADSLLQQGVEQSQTSQFREALQSWQAALEIYREIGDRSGEAGTLNNIGFMQKSLGNYPSALEYYQQSLAITQEIGDRAGEAQALNNIGIVNDLQENYPSALDYYQQSLVITQEIGDRATESATLQNTGIAYRDSGQYQQAEEVLFEAAAILESLRSSELSEADRVNLFETQRDTYAALQTVLIAQNQPGKALEVAERGRARILVEQMLSQLNGQSETTVPVEFPQLADIRRIAQQQNATLVEYSLIEIREEALLYIWVVRPTGEITFRQVSLNDFDASLDSLINRSREVIGVRSRGGFELANPDDAEQSTVLNTLHQILIAPIADLIPTDPLEHVIFIPQDELFLVPFVALQDAAGEYLIQRHTIRTASSIQMVDVARQQRYANGAIRVLDPGDLLLVGNPTMPAIFQSLEQPAQPLSPLPGAEAEINAIAQLFETRAFVGDEASESLIREELSSIRIAHLATHGLLDYGNPEASGRLDIPGAIALAPDATDDGLLTSAEIRTLDLRADLVVLSACDTGLGRITGDGVVGLSRSLLLSGTSSVIVSLWSVPDAPTAELMVEFYRQWQENGLDKAQALRQAMLMTMATHPDPEDWAAFTLIGEAD